MRKALGTGMLLLLSLVATGRPLEGQDTAYFTAREDARRAILALIAAETIRIDIAVWWFTDRAIADAVVRRFHAGVQVRFLGDANTLRNSETKAQIDYLEAQGIPVRLRAPAGGPGILHWKCGIFAGQEAIAFGSANWMTGSLMPSSSSSYDDDSVLVTRDPHLVPAFKMQFDRMWVDTTSFSDYGNIGPGVRVRLEPDAVLPPSTAWGQGPEYNRRLIAEIDEESSFIDIVVYRLIASTVTDALLRRAQAGVRVRVILDPVQYRNKTYPEPSANLDRLWAAGVTMKRRIHGGMTHLKTIVTSSVASEGSSNITDTYHRDHNYFIDRVAKPALYQRYRDRLAAMVADTAGFADFRPSPPGAATLVAPADGGTGVSRTPTLDWTDAAWATSYDVLLGSTTTGMTTVASGLTASRLTIASTLSPSTRYYWRVRARTHATRRDASLSAMSSTLSFVTTASGSGGTTSPTVAITNPTAGATLGGPAIVQVRASAGDADGSVSRVEFFRSGTSIGVDTASPFTCAWSVQAPGTYALTAVATDNTGARTTSAPVSVTVVAENVVLYAAGASLRRGAWTPVADATAAGGSRIYDSGGSTGKVATPLAQPEHYFEMRFAVQAGRAYRLWMRGRADGNSYEHDSVWVQFTNARNRAGSPAWGIGSTTALALSLEECSGCGLSGWGWHDNGWGVGVRGESVYFATSGIQTMRVQRRQDRVSIDQFVLSPVSYYSTAPGAPKNDTTILPASAIPGAPDVVLRMADVPTTQVVGAWTRVSDSTAARGVRLWQPNRGVAKIGTPAASPTHYFDITFSAEAGRPYHVWMRLHAEGDSYTNDSVFLQFDRSTSSSGTPMYRVGTTSAAVVSLEDAAGAGVRGWGWNDNGWASLGPHVYFAQGGSQRLRVQAREDGVSIDQIVISPARYLQASPGLLKSDATIVP